MLIPSPRCTPTMLLYSEIVTDDHTRLQENLDDINRWSTDWQLTISAQKLFILGTQTTASKIPNNSVIHVPFSFKDLEAILTRNLSLIRISITSLVVHNKKCFVSLDRSTLVRAFTTNVCPLLKYASSVWSPQSAGLIKTVQSIKRHFTANLPGSKRLTYIEDLNLKSVCFSTCVTPGNNVLLVFLRCRVSM